MGAAAWIESKQSLHLGRALYQIICNEQCSLDMSGNYIIRYQSSPKVNYYSDFDFHLKSFNHFINDAELPTNRNKYFEDHMDPISFHLCAIKNVKGWSLQWLLDDPAWMTLTPFSHQRLTDTFRWALPEVVVHHNLEGPRVTLLKCTSAFTTPAGTSICNVNSKCASTDTGHMCVHVLDILLQRIEIVIHGR